jgi:hypothetical protein
MKTKTFTQIILCCLLAQSSFTQEGKIWVTISNPSIVRSIENGTQSNQPMLQSIIHDFNIQTIEKAVPSSRKLSLQSLYEITCDCNDQLLLAELKKIKSVFENPEIGPKYELLYTPNDYSLVTSNDYALNLINAQAAWDITKGDTSIYIGISDSNYDLTHEELIGKYILPSTTINYNTNIAHGTAVALTAAGNTDNGIGKSAIGFNSQLHLRKMGYNELLNASYAGVKVVNASWNSGCSFSSYAQTIIDEIYENGTFIVAAAGNGGTCGGASNLVYPAALNHVFAVSSVCPTNNHEATPGNAATTFQHNDSVDLCAPGYNVLLSIASGNYLTGNGTSFSAPYVSGTVALMLAVNPCLTLEQIEQILKVSAFPLDSLNPSYSGKLGAGRLDVGAAVQLADSFNLKLSAIQSYKCNDGSQQISVSIIGSTIPFSISWNTGDSTASLSTVQAGIEYTATVIDSNGCIGHISAIPDTILPLSYESDIQHLTCNGSQDGTIALAISGGKENYSYYWSNGATSDSLTQLAAGEYHVNVVDQLGCSLYIPFSLNEPEKLSSDLFVLNEANSNQFSVDLTVGGGTFPYTFNWNNGSTMEDLQHVEDGFYFVQIKDYNNCTAVDSIQISPIVGVGGTIGIIETTEKDFSIYPNPTNEDKTIHWNTSEIARIECYDMKGKLLENYGIEKNQKAIELNHFTSGIYSMKITLKNGKIIRKKLILN